MAVSEKVDNMSYVLFIVQSHLYILPSDGWGNELPYGTSHLARTELGVGADFVPISC